MVSTWFIRTSHKRSKCPALRFTDIKTLGYLKSNYIIFILPAHKAVYGAVNCVATLNHTITHSIIADIHRWLWCSPRQVNWGGGCRLSLKIGWRLQTNEGNSCHISTSTKRKGMNRFQTKNSCTFTVIGLNSDFIPTVWLCKWSLLYYICVSDLHRQL